MVETQKQKLSLSMKSGIIPGLIFGVILFYFRQDKEIAGVHFFGWDDQAYGVSDELIDPNELLTNPYSLDGHSGIITENSLRFHRLIAPRIATFGVGADNEEIAVILPAAERIVLSPSAQASAEADPPDSMRAWRVYVEEPIRAHNGFGVTSPTPTVRFVSYYTPTPLSAVVIPAQNSAISPSPAAPNEGLPTYIADALGTPDLAPGDQSIGRRELILGSSGQRQFIPAINLTTDCGASSCFWRILDADTNQEILPASDGALYKTQKITNGYYDIVVASGTAVDEYLNVYKYSNGKYMNTACYERSINPDGPAVLCQ